MRNADKLMRMACMRDASRIASIVAIMALCLGLYCYVKRRGCPRWCLSLWHRLLGCIFPSQFQRNKSLLPEVASPKQEVSSVPLPTKGGGRTAVTNEGLDSVAGLIKMRLHLSNGTPQLGGGSPVALPPSGRYFGQYEECGKMKEVTYNLEFLKDGYMSGRCEDDDGELQVRGAFDTKAEVYRWGETMKGAKYTKLENLPSQYESEVVSGKQFHVEVIMRYEGKLTAELVGEYFSSTGAQDAAASPCSASTNEIPFMCFNDLAGHHLLLVISSCLERIALDSFSIFISNFARSLFEVRWRY
ncbi:unnamed protein product [Ostreobium quekettii]|uniref:Uncharacterized protein n=1 Tax=Ostreobium quekettii TaxID=121088 RepID=A0A8S1JCY7_9CHLO|nr:unnamed protein product [Ostreobium quekettii]|eukprot:evm.model.scf_44.11 EVM.evm.TU.scf_44.11   scf_44:184297-189090(+)